MGEIYQMSPDCIIVNSNGAEMTVNPINGNVQVYASHPNAATKTYFNKVLRDIGIDKRIAFVGGSDNQFDVIPLEDVI